AAPNQDRDVVTASLRLLMLAPETVDVARIAPCVQSVDHVVRRVTFQLLAKVATVPAMDVLVGRVALEEGIPQVELIHHLHALTEQQFPDGELWKKWWDENRGSWTRDTERVEQAERTERQPYSRYFGLELRSARVLFVIDRSGSMSWGV